MAQLRIDLQEGFVGDTVVISLNGQELFREPNLRTRLQVGLAKLITAEADEAVTTVAVSLIERKLSAVFTVDTSLPAFLGVSVAPGGPLVHRISREPFGYV